MPGCPRAENGERLCDLRGRLRVACFARAITLVTRRSTLTLCCCPPANWVTNSVRPFHRVSGVAVADALAIVVPYGDSDAVFTDKAACTRWPRHVSSGLSARSFPARPASWWPSGLTTFRAEPSE